MTKQKNRGKKTRYHVYQSAARKHANLIVSRTPVKREASDWATMTSFCQQYDIDEVATPFTEQDQFDTLRDEYVWEQAGRPAIFIDTPTINTLLAGSCKINNFTDHFMPFEAYSLCLPADFECLGVKISGVLVNYYPDHAHYLDNLRAVGKRLSIPVKESDTHDPDRDFDDNGYIGLRYNIKANGDQVAGTGICNVSLDEAKVLAQCATVKAYERKMRKIYGELGEDNPRKLDKPLLTLQYTLLKLAMNLAVYAKAKPEILQSGFPAKSELAMSSRDEAPIKAMRMTIGSKRRGQGLPLSEHHRSWFLRQLSHEKYYQGEYAHLRHGDRFVFVDECAVAGAGDPHHISLN